MASAVTAARAAYAPATDRTTGTATLCIRRLAYSAALSLSVVRVRMISPAVTGLVPYRVS